ncbi:MAG TPA: maleylpyruvate isomerase family mycothiol-dependent enzyme [Chloroflexota bacterium]|nr:maleylpyruvate isomerase family mycothiol-dependent enzyme [Chloroflexota bacterium]
MTISSEVQTEVEIYLDARRRLVEVIRSIPDDMLERQVPSTPLWTARQLVAHLVGAGEDFINRNFPTSISFEEWTATQVARRADDPMQKLLVAWEEIFPRVIEAMESAGVPTRPLINDTVVHEQDLRGMIGAAGGRDAPGYEFATKVACERFSGRIRDADLPAIALETDDWTVTAGSGDPTGRVRAGSFELFRSLWGRRSAEQMKALDWSVEPDRYVRIMPNFGPSVFAIVEA